MSLAKMKEGAFPGTGDFTRVLHQGHEVWMPQDTELKTSPGLGIDGIAEVCKWGVFRSGGLIHTMGFIDLTGLNSSAAGDIIGDDGVAGCYIGQYTKERMGTLIGGRVSCLETPAGGEPDIDLYSATEATGTEDAAITGLTETALMDAGADWTALLAPKGMTALPADDEYFYLVGSGTGTDATYTAGKLLIEFFGHVA